MCYYNGQNVTKDEYIQLKYLEKLVSGYHFLNRDLQIGFDYNLNAVLKPVSGKEDFDIVQMEWGFIPHYLKTREDVFKMRNGYKDATGKWKPGIVTLNATCEELLQPGKIYRDATLKRRCLVLSTGFYEWRHVYPLNKRTGRPLKTANKYPYFISLKNKNYFFMAGIWQPWTDKASGEYVESFAIVTTKANPLMEQVHNSKKRMPVILNEDLAFEWLLGNPDEKRILEISATRFPASEMQAHTISKDFRNQLNSSEQFDYKEIRELQLNF